ncbi:MAG: cadmium-translocating P-type ATPase [Verrucomicrobia bacterium]|nr:MAG: cadmium-translocating P-type ATPase [Verrucomicrobiota bacterium]TAE86955.1 MAG: cadmium-translocating P-type ATPase [Verrucomicrobiota bacterium]TAF24746.1 MAG: cadmium-translocating P-type ATPase [Verrucomicrobiota bacterium]
MTDQEKAGWPWLLSSAAICGVATLAGVWVERGTATPEIATGLYATAYLAGGWEAAIETYGKLRRMRLDIHFLMLAVAAGAAMIGAWWEGAALLFLFSLSGALEAMAMARTEREIRSLFRDAPKRALVVDKEGVIREVAVADLESGMTIRVLPGEQFPADGRITEGESAADESSLTGESVAVEKVPGDTIFGGTLNTWGVIQAEVTRPPGDSAQARIIRLIREAQASKAPSQRFTDRFGTSYTVGILGFSFSMFLYWHWGAGIPAFLDHGERSAFYRAMTLLVVCSPCALVISIPSAILAGIAAGARRGILFRGGVALENLAAIRRLAVDKTGTLTKGELELLGSETSPPGHEDELLGIAAALSGNSTHPLSRAIVKEALRRDLPDAGAVVNFESLAGRGLKASVGGKAASQGRRAMFPDDAWLTALPDPEPGLTEVLVKAGDLRGRLLLRDAPRTEAAPLIRLLAAEGIRVTMLTGDRPESAQWVARELGLQDFRAGLHPEDKVAAIQEWRAQGEMVAMAGDGVNDAPSLAAADISIGMGLRGSDAVLEQADIVLTRDKLERIVDALHLSRRCRSIIRQNLALSLGVVVLLAIAALASWIPLPLGVLGHEGSTVVVVLNSLRLLFWRKKDGAAGLS